MKDEKNNNSGNATFAFDKKNYMWMLIGFAVIILGFVLMAGGKTDDPAVFSDEIFSDRRIVVAPIVIFIGFGLEIFAILKKSDKTKKEITE